jgi:hypothetical protein
MYQRNNIAFRRVSASHFVSFYQAKEFMLGEILDIDKHHFSPTAREILLQYYSVITDILMDVEQECIKRGTGMVDDALIESCHSILRNGLLEMRNRVTLHPSDFDARFTNIWTEVLDATLDHIGSELAKVIKVDIYTSFGRLVQYVIGYLNHILFVLHEIDYLINGGDSPFMYIDRWDLFMKMDADLCTNEVRLLTYIKAGLLGDHIILKYELDDEWLGKDPQRIVAYQYAVDLFHRHSIRCEIQRRS